MVKHAVQYDFDPQFFRILGQRAKIRLGAEQPVDFHIIARIVTVIGVRLEDRIQIDDVDAERGQIAEFFPNSV